MSRLVAFASVLALVGLVASPGSANELTISPGVGIGKVRLGMTRAQVVRALGRDYIVDARDTLGGAQYVELGWNFDTWSVGLLRSGSTYRVVKVATSARSQRSPKGVGPWSFWLPLRRAYPYGVCTWSYEGAVARLEYLVPHKGGTATLYRLDSYPPNRAPRTARVSSVEVRSRYEPLPEFAPGYRGRCRPETLRTAFPHP